MRVFILTITMVLVGFAVKAETVEWPTRIEIDTHIDLPFPVSAVWAVLSDVERYPDWNPYHIRVDGALAEGQRLELEIHKPNNDRLVIHPTVMQVLPERSLVWGGGIPGLFRGIHRFDLQTISASCTRLHQTEVFSGLFVNFAALDAIEQGYAGMNDALLAYMIANSERSPARC